MQVNPHQSAAHDQPPQVVISVDQSAGPSGATGRPFYEAPPGVMAPESVLGRVRIPRTFWSGPDVPTAAGRRIMTLDRATAGAIQEHLEAIGEPRDRRGVELHAASSMAWALGLHPRTVHRWRSEHETHGGIFFGPRDGGATLPRTHPLAAHCRLFVEFPPLAAADEWSLELPLLKQMCHGGAPGHFLAKLLGRALELEARPPDQLDLLAGPAAAAGELLAGTRAELAAALDCSPRTVQGHLSTLEAGGWVSLEGYGSTLAMRIHARPLTAADLEAVRAGEAGTPARATAQPRANLGNEPAPGCDTSPATPPKPRAKRGNGWTWRPRTLEQLDLKLRHLPRAELEAALRGRPLSAAADAHLRDYCAPHRLPDDPWTLLAKLQQLGPRELRIRALALEVGAQDSAAMAADLDHLMTG